LTAAAAAAGGGGGGSIDADNASVILQLQAITVDTVTDAVTFHTTSELTEC